MRHTVKISAQLHNGKIQYRAYYPKESVTKPNSGYVWYRTEGEAKHAVKVEHALKERFGRIAQTVNVAELVEARSAREQLEGTGVSVVDAAKYVRGALDRSTKSKSVKDGLGAYHAAVLEKFKSRKKTSPRCEPKHWRSVGYTIRRLESIQDLSLRELTPDQLRPLFKGLSKSSLKGHLANLHAAFQYCIDEEWMDENPVSKLKRLKPDKPTKPRSIQTFTVKQVRDFMKAIAEDSTRAVPYFAITFFAGVRPEAVMKMTWADVSKNGYLYVPHLANKTGHSYNTKILSPLAEWLEWWTAKGNKKSGYIWPLSDSTLKRVRKSAMKKADIKTWVNDGARKTFATAHRTTFNCKVLTSGALGHKGTTILDEYYDSRLMTPEEASSYWKISPDVVRQNNGGSTL